MTNHQKLVTRMNKMRDLIDCTVLAINELPNDIDFDYFLSSVLNPGELQINMSYNIENYKVLRRKLGKNYKFLGRWFHQEIGSYFVEFRHKSLNVRLDIQLKLATEETAASKCKLEVVGHTEPRPIYKVVCE